MDAAPNLKVISNYAVGYDNVDVAQATRRGVVVTNTPGVLTEATAELALGLLLAAARCIPASDRFVREGRFLGWSPNLFLGTGLSGKVLGIAGAGRIGQALGRRATGLGLRLLYCDHRDRLDFEKETGAKKADKDELLKRADFISLHLPLTAETRHFLAWEDFLAMKPTAVLVNTARGPVVDEAALVRALKEGEIRAAGLDVYEDEPRVHPGLLVQENAVLVPHIGSATVETRARMAELATRNLLDILEGLRPAHVVNPELFD
jgi:glyoxylate reductase